jgi:hypothetical protein
MLGAREALADRRRRCQSIPNVQDGARAVSRLFAGPHLRRLRRRSRLQWVRRRTDSAAESA